MTQSSSYAELMNRAAATDTLRNFVGTQLQQNLPSELSDTILNLAAPIKITGKWNSRKEASEFRKKAKDAMSAKKSGKSNSYTIISW